ncbi:hypothetical protein FACUT_8203 [Fusarium acutatum]|uniref:EthD domain-containing protein n=1 Tax=Fusarium acutatum TaxID=78861 RepID=A0A8H4JK32_9HYPO|nr:hypothetical protein FACUT_8203 [Fusarium acutatum]
MSAFKILVTSCRKHGMTRKEAQDYFYEVHGSLAQSPDPNANLAKYTQLHFFDTASYSEKGNDRNDWDLGGELYFESEEQLARVYQSSWVREKVSPDNLNFSDTNSTRLRMARDTVIFKNEDIVDSPSTRDKAPILALYFVEPSGSQVSTDKLVDGFADILKLGTTDEIWALYVNTPFELSAKASILFKSQPFDELIFSIYLKRPQSIPAFRKAQKDFEDKFAHSICLEKCQTALGSRVVIYNNEK